MFIEFFNRVNATFQENTFDSVVFELMQTFVHRLFLENAFFIGFFKITNFLFVYTAVFLTFSKRFNCGAIVFSLSEILRSSKYRESVT